MTTRIPRPSATEPRPESRSTPDPVRVAIDLTALLPQRTGVDQYLLGLTQALARADRDSRYLLYVNREDLAAFDGMPPNFRVLARCARPRAARLVFQQAALPALAAAAHADVIHSPAFIKPLAGGGPRHLLTVHDMTSFSRPDLHTRLRGSHWYRRAVLWSLRGADRVSVPSRSVAEEIRRLVPGLPPGRIQVAAPGVREEFRPHSSGEVRPVLDRLGVRAPYILFVGTVEPRKNLLGLVDAYRALVERTAAGEQLVIAGRLGWGYEPVLAAVASSGLSARIRMLDYVDGRDLPALYAGARVFAYPSLAEGFGFPPLEAMASGVPTLASDCTSLRENLAGAAELTPPGDVGALTAGLERLLTDEALARRRAAAGLRRAADFRWARTAEQTLASYRELAAMPRPVIRSLREPVRATGPRGS